MKNIIAKTASFARTAMEGAATTIEQAGAAVVASDIAATAAETATATVDTVQKSGLVGKLLGNKVVVYGGGAVVTAGVVYGGYKLGKKFMKGRADKKASASKADAK